MALIPENYESGKTVLMGVATGVTVNRGDMLVDNGSGYLTEASVGGNVDVRYVAAETVTTTADGQLVLCWETNGVKFLADTDAAWSVTDVGTECDIATAATLDPDASDDDVFYIESGVGTAETDTQVRGYFTRGVPNS
jgi:hypothetical protein